MAASYRSWAARQEIIHAIIAESAGRPLSDFALSDSEEVFFRARAARAVDHAAKATSAFKAYYALPTERPFKYVLVPAAVIAAVAVMIALYIWASSRDNVPYPLLGACFTALVVATGWAVAGGITHRNTIRQNTNNMIFARFSQATFGESVHRFHIAFGHEPTATVSREAWLKLRASGDPDDKKAAEAAIYILNYYEFISSGVIRGDLDKEIIRDNIRGLICYYHDKCLPLISFSNKQNPRVFANLIKMRTHYREP